jgi:hypothetical protein
MQKEMDDHRREQGLTGKVAGAGHVGIADAFWSDVLGYDMMAYYNPLKSMFPWANTAGAAEARPDENPYETYLRLSELVGLPTPTPIFQAGMRMVGAQGDAPPQNLVRNAGVLQGIGAALGVNRGKGIDIGTSLGAGERRLREAFGQEVADPAVTGAMNRVNELYLGTHGKPISQAGPEGMPFIEAAALQQGPVWDVAQRQLAKERGLRSALGWTFSPLSPQALVTSEEAQIRLAREHNKVLAPGYGKKLQQEAFRNPTAPARPEDIEIIRNAALYTVNKEFGLTELPQAAAKLLEQGTNLSVNQVRQDILNLNTERHPMTAGYSQSGSAEEAKLQALLGLSANLPFKQPGGAVLKQLSEDRTQGTVTGVGSPKTPYLLQPAAARVKAERDNLGELNPMLARYTAWKDKNPAGTTSDFLEWYRREGRHQ